MSANPIVHRARPHILALSGYVPGLQPQEPGWIKLNTNENAYPPSPRVVEALRGFTFCLEDPREKGIVYGLGAWNKGDIQGNPAMEEAYRLGAAIQ